jgi:hypothetical protein
MANDMSQFSKDYYKTVEIWGGWNIGKRFQLIAILPYNFVHQVSDDGQTNKQGIGDIALMGNYKLFDQNSTIGKNIKVSQQFWLGLGVKLPTGKFKIDDFSEGVAAKANTQLGSGSTDVILSSMYNVQINKLGINTGVSYKMNSSNKDKYAFGNKFSANSFVFYSIKKGLFGVIPNIGFRYENSQANTLLTQTVDQTNGHFFAALAGLELNIKAVSIGANIQFPVAQNMANGQTKLNNAGMVHVTLAF